MSRFIAAVAAALGMVSGAALAQQPPPEQHVRGEVVAVKGDTVEVKARSGEHVTFDLAEKTRVSLLSKSDRARITQGAYVGAAAIPQGDGTLRAVEVHLFPEAARGTGEGHRPWDLQAGSTMTNATVSGVAGAGGGGSTMTNATVASKGEGEGGLRLTMRYKDGEKTLVVPPGAPVVQVEPADRSRLEPGARVFAAVKDEGGKRVADRIYVGKDVAPPM